MACIPSCRQPGDVSERQRGRETARLHTSSAVEAAAAPAWAASRLSITDCHVAISFSPPPCFARSLSRSLSRSLARTPPLSARPASKSALAPSCGVTALSAHSPLTAAHCHWPARTRHSHMPFRVPWSGQSPAVRPERARMIAENPLEKTFGGMRGSHASRAASDRS